MIRIWKGIEKEGIGQESEIMTLFVCADEPVNFSIIHRIIEEDDTIKAIYLGAGRVPFNGFADRGYGQLIWVAEKHNLKIIMECEPDKLVQTIKQYWHPSVLFIPAYYDFPFNVNNIYFKTDDVCTTRIFNIAKKVDITEVQNNMYLDDVEIYRKED